MPDDAEVVRLLKDGYWDRTAVVRMRSGELRVRKEHRPSEDVGPWALESLRREIRYLKGLEAIERDLFPELLDAWGAEDGSPLAGYDMPYFEGWRDLGGVVTQAGSKLAPEDARSLECRISAMVIDTLHSEVPVTKPMSQHVRDVVELVFGRLANRDPFSEIINAETIEVDRNTFPGLRPCFETISSYGLLEQLDLGPQVRLHGDLILENVLWNPATATQSVIFIDPVSVAGATAGPPLFDLVKYESYASGELYSIRSGNTAGGVLDGSGYHLTRDPLDPGVVAFRNGRWGQEYRKSHVDRYGHPDPALYHLLDGYFSLAMAVNTTGSQPLTRLLSAVLAFAAACKDAS